MKFFNFIGIFIGICIGCLLPTPITTAKSDIQIRDQGDYICFFTEGSMGDTLSCVSKPVEWIMTCVPTMKPYCPEYIIKPRDAK
jgi:hypothetical protein